MSCLKHKLERDPEYDDAESPQEVKKWKRIEENAQSQAADRIVGVIEREFEKELEHKEEQLLDIDARIQEAHRLLPLLRYAVIASYYGQKVSQVPGRSSEGQALQTNIHPAIKQFFNVKSEKEDEPPFEASVEHESVVKKSESKVPRYIPPKSDGVKTLLSSPTRSAHCKSKRRIVIGNVSKWVPVDSRDDTNIHTSHKWMMYVRGPRDFPDVSDFIKRVRFFLHPSYHPNDVVDVNDPPFHLTRRGWGEFPVRVQLHFYNSLNKPVDVIHHLRLDRTYTGLQNLGAETIVDLWLHTKGAEAVPGEERIRSELKPQLRSPSSVEMGLKENETTSTSVPVKTSTDYPQDHDYLGFKSEPSDRDSNQSECASGSSRESDQNVNKHLLTNASMSQVNSTATTVNTSTMLVNKSTTSADTSSVPVNCNTTLAKKSITPVSSGTILVNTTNAISTKPANTSTITTSTVLVNSSTTSLSNTSTVLGKSEVPFVKCAGMDGKIYLIPSNLLKLRTNSGSVVGVQRTQKVVELNDKALNVSQSVTPVTPKPTAVVLPTLNKVQTKEVDSSVVTPPKISPAGDAVKDGPGNSCAVPSAASPTNKVLLMLKNGRLFVINNKNNNALPPSLQSAAQKLSAVPASRPGVSLLKKKSAHETVSPSMLTGPVAVGQSILKKKVQDTGPNLKVLKYEEELRNLEKIPITSFKSIDSALRYLLQKLPIVSSLASDVDYRTVHPYSTISVCEFLKWNIGKQRGSEWFRARLLRKILTTQGHPKDRLKSTKQIVIWARRHAYTPLPPVVSKTGGKTAASKDERFPSTYSEAVDILESLEVSAPTTLDTEVDIDVENVEDEDNKPFVKGSSEVSPKIDTSVVIPVEAELQNLTEHVKETARGIGVSLQPEAIETGVKYPAVERILVECFQLLASDLLRNAHRYACDRENAENPCRSPKEITLADVYNTLVNQPEFDIFTNKGLGSQIADNC